MAAFNDAKSRALELGHDYSSYLVEGDHGRYVNTTIGLTCAWDKTEEDAGEYYVNKDYYYAKETDTDTVIIHIIILLVILLLLVVVLVQESVKSLL